MKPFRKAGGKTWQVRTYSADGTPHDHSTETRERAGAVAIARAVEKLRDRARFRPLYDALHARRFTPNEVWLADERDHLDELLAALDAVDLEPLVADFHAALKGKVADDTRNHYHHAVRTLVADGVAFPSSLLTTGALQDWIDGMEEVGPSTQRKRGMGMRRFTEWLVRVRGVLEADPMRDVELPAQGDPLCHYLDTPEAEVLGDRQPGQYRHYSYVLAGTALEVSTALAVRVRSVSKEDKSIHAPGTKTYNRDRVVRVAEWAWPAVLELLKGKTPNALLFDGVTDRWIARDRHNEAALSLVSEGCTVYQTPKLYTMRDHRHTWAVRAARSGWPIEAVSRQLGHANGVLALKVYGRFVPRAEELAKWEAMATARDNEMRQAK